MADKKKEVFDGDLEAIVQDEVFRMDMPERFKLLSLNVESGTSTTPTARVELEVDGVKVGEECRGRPVDAAFKTIAMITGTKARSSSTP